MTIRVGEGQTPSGKILDRGTQAYVYIKQKGIDERLHAIQYARKTNRNIYVSSSKRAYRLITAEQLMKL